MTAEIAVMNRMAVALAADSASTARVASDRKIYNTVNKLFALSKYHPVGIMVYGRAAFMRIPFESLIKVYRARLGEKHCATLQEYADDFRKFLGQGAPLIPEDVQSREAKSMLSRFIAGIAKRIDEECRQFLRAKPDLSPRAIRQIVSLHIEHAYDRVTRCDLLPSFTEKSISHITHEYGTIIDDVIRTSLEKLPMTQKASCMLREACGHYLCRDTFDHGVSGVVVAGFGQDEVFPSVRAYVVDALVDNTLRWKESVFTSISFEQVASIIPFAQSEMVNRFMEGVDPDYQQFVSGWVSRVFADYPRLVLDSIGKLTEDEKTALTKPLKKLGDRLIDDFEREMRNYRLRKNADPIIGSVAFLPKDELASMAEALVNLTSLKRRVSLDEAETVGGAVDVAVISKGDGFVWIKRKHYFDPSLNHHFSANYYRQSRPCRAEGGGDCES